MKERDTITFILIAALLVMLLIREVQIMKLSHPHMYWANDSAIRVKLGHDNILFIAKKDTTGVRIDTIQMSIK